MTFQVSIILMIDELNSPHEIVVSFFEGCRLMDVVAEIRQRSGKYLSVDERGYIARAIAEGESVDAIAKTLGRHRSTIYRELDRGSVEQQKSTKTEYKKLIKVYEPDYAQSASDHRQAHKGIFPKLAHDINLVALMDNLMLDNQWSPKTVIGRLRYDNKLSISICVKTLYNYVNNGRMITKPENLPRKGKQKKHQQSLYKRPKNTNTIGNSIELRPLEVVGRKVFGHWEGDLVVGGKYTSKACLLTLVERKTRFAVVYKLPNAKLESVLAALGDLENSLGENVSQIIKTITWDNGTSFAKPKELERARSPNKVRWRVFYAHPYRSWERGSNENFNGFIRRKIPKGCDIGKYTVEKVAEITNWINCYPRKILGWLSAKEAFDKELQVLVS